MVGHPGPILEGVLYAGVYLMATPMALRNIAASYRDGSGKMRPVMEALRPLASFFLAMALCVTWASLSPNGVLVADTR